MMQSNFVDFYGIAVYASNDEHFQVTYVIWQEVSKKRSIQEKNYPFMLTKTMIKKYLTQWYFQWL